MRIALSNDRVTTTDADLLVVGLRSPKPAKEDVLSSLDKAMGKEKLIRLIKEEGFTAKAGQTLRVPAAGRLKCGWVLLVGLGKGSDSPADARKLALEGVRACRRQRSVAVFLPESNASMVRAATEGALNGSYRYDTYKTGSRKPKDGARSVGLLVADKSDAELKKALDEGKAVGEAVNLARDLVNAPPNDLTPIALAAAAKEQADAYGLSCEIWDKKKIQKQSMRLFLAVNAGSAVEPRLIHVAHRPKGAKKKVVFVGKGLTFDSGGLCIKPAQSMSDMKCDMAGAATTLGIAVAAARLGLPIEVHGVIGSTDNMTGADAYRPGDVFTSREGKTVEIINTDAEGRLVLADVLDWATSLEPDVLVDHATLTGACMVALGPYTAGLFSNDDRIGERYEAAAREDGESFWRLPLSSDLRPSLDSDVADIKHVGGRFGGTITAALFLREFVGKSKWVHVDIAGPAFVDHAHGRSPKGGTGFGISTAIRFLEGLVSDDDA